MAKRVNPIDRFDVDQKKIHDEFILYYYGAGRLEEEEAELAELDEAD
jgi:hypothetical protein